MEEPLLQKYENISEKIKAPEPPATQIYKIDDFEFDQMMDESN